jgi:8-oxo-dGTP diphosphatase
MEVVAAILVNSNNEILLARRNKNKSWGNYWELPGGKIEQGESPIDALKRELHEELSLYIEEATLFCSSVLNHDNTLISINYYIVELPESTIELTDHSEITFVKSIHEIPEKIIPSDQQVLIDFINQKQEAKINKL